MKILKRGNPPKDKRREVCHNCGSELEYISSDIHIDRDGKYIICPVCGKFIGVQ